MINKKLFLISSGVLLTLLGLFYIPSFTIVQVATCIERISVAPNYAVSCNVNETRSGNGWCTLNAYFSDRSLLSRMGVVAHANCCENDVPSAPSAPIKEMYMSVEYILSSTTRTIYNPMTGKSTTQTIDPDYTCTPYKVASAWEHQFVYEINYKNQFETKEEAINSTLASLENCLQISYSPTIGNNANYVFKLTGTYTISPPNSAKAAYNNNFNAKSACAAYPGSGFNYLVSNANTCVNNSPITWPCTLSNGLPATCSGTAYNGVSKQVDYKKTLPEAIHLRSLWCYNTPSFDCTVKDALVPTYKYNGELDIQISSINHGLEISWADIEQKIGTKVLYDILKKDSNGNYNIINPRTAITAFKDNRLKDLSKPQYYKVEAYSNNSLIATALADNSDMPPIFNEVSVTINGTGFAKEMEESAVISMSKINGSGDPDFVPFTIYCSEFTYQDSHTADVKCNITDAPTGVYDVIFTMGDKTYTLSRGFTVTYPKPTATTIENVSSNLDDRVLKIGAVKGDNLYIGAIIGVKSGDKMGTNHYTLDYFDYDTNSFYCNDPIACPDGLMKFYIGDIMNFTNGDLSKIEIYLANDDGSIISEYKDAVTGNLLTLQDLNTTCSHKSWGNWSKGDPSGLCPGNPTTRIDNCGITESSSGTLICDPITQTCNVAANQCVCRPETKAELCANKLCGAAQTRCGNYISCTNYDKGVCDLQGRFTCGDSSDNKICEKLLDLTGNIGICANTNQTKCYPCVCNGFGYPLKSDGSCPTKKANGDCN